MRMKLAIAACMGLAMSGWVSSASAHHAFAAEFDANNSRFRSKMRRSISHLNSSDLTRQRFPLRRLPTILRFE
jgi:hypothetical protein